MDGKESLQLILAKQSIVLGRHKHLCRPGVSRDVMPVEDNNSIDLCLMLFPSLQRVTNHVRGKEDGS